MGKGVSSGYEDASSSKERERQSDWKARKLRAELEEAEQAKKVEVAKEAKEKEAEDKEARDKEAGVEEAKTEVPGERQASRKKRTAG